MLLLGCWLPFICLLPPFLLLVLWVQLVSPILGFLWERIWVGAGGGRGFCQMDDFSFLVGNLKLIFARYF